MKLLMTMYGALSMPLVIGASSESLAAQVTDTQTKFSMLCVAEKGTGFNWRNNDWVQTDYKPYTYVLTKVEPQEWDCASQKVSQQISPVSEARGESHGCYQLKEVGD